MLERTPVRLALLFILSLLALWPACAQEITGAWHGILKVQGSQLRLVFHIEADEQGYRATLDSPDQGAEGIPVTSTRFEAPDLELQVVPLGITYKGTQDPEGGFSGTFTQGGISLPLDLTREIPEKEAPLRPQEPKEPFPYLSREVVFPNQEAGIRLAGTFTRPRAEGRYPAVVLISGSGPQNRDQEIFGHKPFLVLADHLTRQGIAVLRYDDRGTAASTGDFGSATSKDFATDVQSAVSYLKSRADVDPEQIGLVGHSEGGLIAPMVASASNEIAFIVMLAGPGLPGAEVLKAQNELIGRANGLEAGALQSQLSTLKGAIDLIVARGPSETLPAALTAYMEGQMEANPGLVPAGSTPEQYVQLYVSQMTSPWMVSFLTTDPGPILEKVHCPVLALIGEKDLQVPAGPNLEAIRFRLANAGNTRVTALELEGLNHLFQECETGSPLEYGAISQTFAPPALDLISTWILEQVRK